MSENIDWAQVKTRLHESQQALDKALTPDPQRTEAIFRERAAQLARRHIVVENREAAERVLVFTLGKERYGLEFGAVAELFPFANCTPVPGGPPQLLGVVNVHGEIRSVVDLSRLLELPEEGQRPVGYVLLVRNEGREVGLRVDGIEKVQAVAESALAGPTDEAVGCVFRYLRGLTADKIRVLSSEALFGHSLFQ